MHVLLSMWVEGRSALLCSKEIQASVGGPLLLVALTALLKKTEKKKEG